MGRKTVTWLLRHAEHDGEECLIWPYARMGNGYANIGDYMGTALAHRAMCIVVYGNPPTPGHHAAHNCGNGHLGCVNPKHLRWATRQENFSDRVLHGTDARGEKCWNAKLSAAKVMEIRELGGSVPNQILAERFGVSRAAISLVRRRKNWGWLE